MREILFRGKRIDNGEWVEGFYCQRKEKILGGIKTRHMILVPDADSYSGARWIDVNPTTVGQYTGLTDKNGKKIFEGDVVKGFYKPTDKLVCGSVKYENHLARMLILNRGVCAGLSHCHHVEVIGNIHDNPELLEHYGD